MERGDRTHLFRQKCLNTPTEGGDYLVTQARSLLSITLLEKEVSAENTRNPPHAVGAPVEAFGSYLSPFKVFPSVPLSPLQVPAPRRGRRLPPPTQDETARALRALAAPFVLLRALRPPAGKRRSSVPPPTAAEGTPHFAAEGRVMAAKGSPTGGLRAPPGGHRAEVRGRWRQEVTLSCQRPL